MKSIERQPASGVGDADVVVDNPADGVIRIGLNRPDRANALDDNAIEQIHHALDAADETECRVVLLCSYNRFFCAGFDMTGYDGDPESRGGAAALVRRMDRLSNLPLRMRAGRQVVIATVRGAAVGGGFGLALGADILLAGTSARFCLPQTRLGVLSTEMGLSYLLPRIVGLNRAANLMLRGDSLDAGAAELAGLVCQVLADDEVDDAGLYVAAELAQRSFNALSGTKQMLLTGLESSHFGGSCACRNPGASLVELLAGASISDRGI